MYQVTWIYMHRVFSVSTPSRDIAEALRTQLLKSRLWYKNKSELELIR